MIIHGNNIGNVYSEDVEDDHIDNYDIYNNDIIDDIC